MRAAGTADYSSGGSDSVAARQASRELAAARVGVGSFPGRRADGTGVLGGRRGAILSRVRKAADSQPQIMDDLRSSAAACCRALLIRFSQDLYRGYATCCHNENLGAKVSQSQPSGWAAWG